MSIISKAVKHMIAAGMDAAAIVAAVEEMERAQEPKLTKRQARNKRYYDNKKASQSVLIKTAQDDSDVSDACDKKRKEKVPPTPPLKENKKNTPLTPQPGGGDAANAARDWFEDFWQVYPSRQNNPKKPARQKFDAAVKRGTDPQSLIDAAKRYAETRQGKDPQFTAQATTWLGQERWTEFQSGHAVSQDNKPNLLKINHNNISERGVVERLLIHFREGGDWRYRTYLGPAPGEAGCLIPDWLVERAKLELRSGASR